MFLLPWSHNNFLPRPGNPSTFKPDNSEQHASTYTFESLPNSFSDPLGGGSGRSRPKSHVFGGPNRQQHRQQRAAPSQQHRQHPHQQLPTQLSYPASHPYPPSLEQNNVMIHHGLQPLPPDGHYPNAAPPNHFAGPNFVIHQHGTALPGNSVDLLPGGQHPGGYHGNSGSQHNSNYGSNSGPLSGEFMDPNSSDLSLSGGNPAMGQGGTSGFLDPGSWNNSGSGHGFYDAGGLANPGGASGGLALDPLLGAARQLMTVPPAGLSYRVAMDRPGEDSSRG